MVSYGINLLKNHCFYGFFFGGGMFIWRYCYFVLSLHKIVGDSAI